MKKKSKSKRSNKICDLNTYIDGNSTKIEIYTKNGCPYCEAAKEFLRAYKPKIIEYVSLPDETKQKIQQKIENQTGKKYFMYPKIFINNEFIGGFTNLRENYSHLNPTYLELKKGWSFF